MKPTGLIIVGFAALIPLIGCVVYREQHPADIQGDTWVKTGLGRIKIVMLEPFLESTLRTVMKLIEFHRE